MSFIGEKDEDREVEKQKLLPWTGVEAFEIERVKEEYSEWESLGERTWEESKKMWEIALPAILTSVSQFLIGFITTAFVGHLGQLELAAVSVVQNVVEGFVFGIMLGLGSALETLCGQAVGAGQFDMLGIYLQRSVIITFTTAILLVPVYVFTSPLLKFLHQDESISNVAGNYAFWCIPQLFAYSLNFPIQKFLQAQSKIWVMTIMSLVVTAFHILLSWVLVLRLGYGLHGAAMAENISWWLLVLAQAGYVFSGYFPEAWTGLSLLAFHSLYEFVKLSLASAVMMCLESWYPTVVILLVGLLPNPQKSVDAISICMNLQLWAMFISIGFNAAVSVRVGNELGAGNAKAAKFSVVVTVITSMTVGITLTALVIATKDYFPVIFTNDAEVIRETVKLAYYLAANILISSIQPVLHGVAVGVGWQLIVAVINIVCYYVVGLPVGTWLGFKADQGVKGMWMGMLSGIVLQTLILCLMIYRANWNHEVVQAEDRVQSWSFTPTLSKGSNNEADAINGSV